MDSERAQQRRQAFKQQVVSNLRGKLRAECMKRGSDMRAALLSNKRATLCLAAHAQPTQDSSSHQGAGPPTTAPNGSSGSPAHLSLEVTHQVASHVRRDVQQAIAASLAGIRPHASSASCGAEASTAASPGVALLPPASGSQQPVYTPVTAIGAPTHAPFQTPGTQEHTGRPVIDWSGIQDRAGAAAGGLFSAQGWLFDDELLEREINAFTQEDMEEVARQLEVELFEEVLAAQLQELTQYQLATDGPASRGGLGEEEVLCPVCHGANLVQVKGVLACPAEGWQLDMRAEAITLAHLKQQLGDVYEAHYQSGGCPGRLAFAIQEPVPQFRHLVATCGTCQLLHIVV